MSAGSLLRLHYGVAATVLLSVGVQALLPPGLLPGSGLLPVDLRTLAAGGGDALAGSSQPGLSLGAGSLTQVWIATALMLLASGAVLLFRDGCRLRNLLRDSHQLRSIGRVRISVHDSVPTPLSCWRPGRAHVVVPAFLLRDGAALRLAIAHELQHHRQRDTLWLYVFAALRVVCALNPCAHAWARAARRTQEFACDEALLMRRSLTPQAYAGCLVDVADNLRGRGSHAGFTSCLIGFGDPNSLRQRIKKMFDVSRGPWAANRVRITVAAICALMTCAAYASSAAADAAPGGAPQSVWPVDGVVLAGFGKHRGIDVAAPAGAAVRAYAAGTVLSVGAIKGCPGRVQIRHGSLIGTYCNLVQVVVASGQAVTAAEVIGAVAGAPEGTKPHLHFELSEQTFIDPQSRLPRISAAH